MYKDKITKEDLIKFVVGEQKTFTLPTWEKARSAQSYAAQMKNASENPMTFVSSIGDAVQGSLQRSITITRMA